MKKIKILFVITGLIFLMYLLHLASYIFLSDYYTTLWESTEDRVVFGQYNFILSFVQSIILFVGIIISLKCIYEIIKMGFFTVASKKSMFWAGVIFLLSGIVASIFDIIRFSSDGAEESTMIGIILMGFMLAIIGLIILIVADMAQTGFQLKSENDLTI